MDLKNLIAEIFSGYGYSIYSVSDFILLVTKSTMYKISLESDVLCIKSKIRHSNLEMDFEVTTLDIGDPELINKLRELVK